MSDAIRLLRWKTDEGGMRLGVGGDERIVPIDSVVPSLTSVPDVQRYCRTQGVPVADWARNILDRATESIEVRPDQYRIPLELGELWACGVTYELSRDAREAETASAQTIYAKVYHAERPELFFKAPGSRVVGPEDFVGLRRDATWHVPEPEMTVILDECGDIFGFTAGNDMTARDLEVENPLYLPQTKTYHHSGSIGPSIVLAGTVDPHALTIALDVRRRDQCVFHGTTSTDRMRRRIEELVRYLKVAWPVAPWTGLMTGTGIVPPEEFALEDGDDIAITVSEIGTLRNTARTIDASWAHVPEGPPRVLRIDARDNVAVALGALESGRGIVVGTLTITVRDPIPFGHKVALANISVGDPIIKYGECIGVATQPITIGQHVHTQNVESQRGRGDWADAKRGQNQ